MSSEADVRVLNTPQDLFQAAAAEFIAVALAAIRDHGRFTVALSGGSTPKSLYSVLAKAASNCLLKQSNRYKGNCYGCLSKTHASKLSRK